MNYCWFWDLERSFPGYPQVKKKEKNKKKSYPQVRKENFLQIPSDVICVSFLQFDVADNILGVVNNQVVPYTLFF